MKRVMVCVGVALLAAAVFGGASSLPSGYERLEWIETDAYTYIKTGYTPKSSDSIYAHVRSPGSSGGTYAIFCARGASGESVNPYTALSIGGKFRFDYGATGTQLDWSNTSSTDYRIAVNDPAGEVRINGSKKYDLPSNTFTAGSEIVLFMWHNNFTSPGGRVAGQRMYAFSVTNENGIAEVDFVPCRKHNSDGTKEVGLYDRSRGGVLGQCVLGRRIRGWSDGGTHRAARRLCESRLRRVDW